MLEVAFLLARNLTLVYTGLSWNPTPANGTNQRKIAVYVENHRPELMPSEVAALHG